MNSKLVTGIALLVFAIIVVNVLAIGLLSDNTQVKSQDYPPINQSNSVSNKANNSNTLTPAVHNSTPPVTQTVVNTSPAPKPNPVRVPVTRAS